jgi:hypothetical protein
LLGVPLGVAPAQLTHVAVVAAGNAQELPARTASGRRASYSSTAWSAWRRRVSRRPRPPLPCTRIDRGGLSHRRRSRVGAGEGAQLEVADAGLAEHEQDRVVAAAGAGALVGHAHRLLSRARRAG